MSYLYILARSDDPTLLKVGRSDNPAKRAKDLQKYQAFYLNVIQVFENKGTHEANVHLMLKEYRINDVPGIEWFRCSVQHALTMVECSQPITKSKR